MSNVNKHKVIWPKQCLQILINVECLYKKPVIYDLYDLINLNSIMVLILYIERNLRLQTLHMF